MHRRDQLSRLEAELESWLGTPYMHGQCVKGVAVDCIRFPVAVLCALYGLTLPAIPRYPGDATRHNPRAVTAVLRAVRAGLPLKVVRDAEADLCPGDLLVLNQDGRGPRHMAIQGAFHTYEAVQKIGVHRSCPDLDIYRVYRPVGTSSWV